MLSPRCTWPVPSTGIFLRQTRPPLPQKARRNASATKNALSVSDRPPVKFPCRHDFLYLPVKYIKWEREGKRGERSNGKSKKIFPRASFRIVCGEGYMHARESTLENRYEGWIRKVEPEANPCLPSERRALFFLEKMYRLTANAISFVHEVY